MRKVLFILVLPFLAQAGFEVNLYDFRPDFLDSYQVNKNAELVGYDDFLISSNGIHIDEEKTYFFVLSDKLSASHQLNDQSVDQVYHGEATVKQWICNSDWTTYLYLKGSCDVVDTLTGYVVARRNTHLENRMNNHSSISIPTRYGIQWNVNENIWTGDEISQFFKDLFTDGE